MYKILVHMYTFISLKNVGDIYDEICIFSTQEKFEDTKGVIRSHKSKKNRQHNDQNKKKTRRQTMPGKILHRKLKIEQRKLH